MAIERFKGEYYFLSNFSTHSIVISTESSFYQGKWNTAEHLYQAMKTLDKNYIKMIRLDPNPKNAKKLGRRAPLRESWEELKDKIMYFVVKEKFLQNPNIRKRLINTGDEELIEGNWWGDTYWGVCYGKGKNKLGKILMELRSELKNEGPWLYFR